MVRVLTNLFSSNLTGQEKLTIRFPNSSKGQLLLVRTNKICNICVKISVAVTNVWIHDHTLSNSMMLDYYLVEHMKVMLLDKPVAA
jgi:hypothetical protein